MELPDAEIEFVARQLQIQSVEIGGYVWTAGSVQRHRAQIREHLGYRECSVADSLGRWSPTAWVSRPRVLVFELADRRLPEVSRLRRGGHERRRPSLLPHKIAACQGRPHRRIMHPRYSPLPRLGAP